MYLFPQNVLKCIQLPKDREKVKYFQSSGMLAQLLMFHVSDIKQCQIRYFS